MTGHTVCAECQEMLGGKWLVDLQMAITACVLIERRSITVHMAILTGERRTIRFFLMGSEFE